MKFFILSLYFFVYSANGKDLNVTLLIPDKKGPLFWELVTDVTDAAAQNLNIELEVIYSDHNRFSILHTIEDIVKRDQKPDYLIFRPLLDNTVTIFDILEKNKVKFVTLEQDYRGQIAQKIGLPQQKYQYWLGQINYDNKAGGELLLNALITEKFKHSPSEKAYITAIGGDFDKVSKDREDIFNHLSKLPHAKQIVLNQIITLHWNPKNLTTRIPLLEKRYPKTNIYWCTGDQMALEVLRLIKNNQPTFIGGFDWLPITLQKIKQKEITASVGGHFLMGAIALLKIVDYEQGHNSFLAPPLLNKFELITRDNVDYHLDFFESKLWDKVNFTQYLASRDKKSPVLSVINLIEQSKQ